jgi:hypothetical protein
LYFNSYALIAMLQPFINEAEENLASKYVVRVDDAAYLLLLSASVALRDGDVKFVLQHD